MAVKVLSLVWDGYPGAGTELLALLALADWSDDEGRCWPSIASISKKTRLSRSQAQRIVHRLIATGYVNVTGNETGGPPGSTRQYLINLDMLTGRMDATPTGRTDATGTAALAVVFMASCEKSAKVGCDGAVATLFDFALALMLHRLSWPWHQGGRPSCKSLR